MANQHGEIKECSGDTGIFIYPGYKFKCMDGLITNFNLPESTLIMLVSAFAGYENTMNTYKLAVEENVEDYFDLPALPNSAEVYMYYEWK